MALNRVQLIGNLGADPELRYTPSNQPICNLRIATGERRKNPEGEWVEHTEWHRVVAFGKTAENSSQYLSKGRQVFVEGRLQTRKWQDKEGKDRYSTEIIAQTVQFLGGKGEGAGGGAKTSPAPEMGGDESSFAAENSSSLSFSDDDIPF